MRDRYHFLDAARGILMILGIAFHAAKPYGVSNWIVKDDATSPFFDALAAFLTSFRMPAFFLISGFFAALTLGKDGPMRFLRKRALRILAPFAATLFSVNVVQLYVLQVRSGGRQGFFAFVGSSELWASFPTETWMSHLWFLGCLIVYFSTLGLGAALAGEVGRGRLASAVGRVASLFARPVLLLSLLPLINLPALALLHAVPGLYEVRPLITMHEVVAYSPFFIVGLCVYSNERLYASMTRFHRGVVVLTAVAGLLLLLSPAPDATLAGRAVHAYIVHLWIWAAIYWVMVLFRAMFDRPSHTAVTLSDASYTIYLFHHLTVVVLASALTGLGLSIFLKYPAVVVATFAITLALHLLLIRRVIWLSWLFNGRRPLARSSTKARNY
jgi:glucan biosynthesis protein C